MVKVLVLGGSGMLGHKLCQELPKAGHEVIATLRKPDPVLATVAPRVTFMPGVDALTGTTLEKAVEMLRPKFVLNAIGVVKQLDLARNRFVSVALNTWLPHRLAELCARVGAKLIHISTDCVFSGRQGGYSEENPSDAEDLYGKSKYLGETDESESSALTLRTSIIGRELHKPSHGLVEWLLQQEANRIKGFARAIYSGFTTIELCRIIGRVIRDGSGLRGLYHVASESISKYDLLLLLRKTLGLRVEIDRDDAFVCDRSLRMSRFTEATGYRAPSWADQVSELCSDPTPYGVLQASGTR